MAKLKAAPTVNPAATLVETYRTGSAANAGGHLGDNDKGKFVKLGGDSQYTLCTAGDPIEGQLVASEAATQDGWSVGSVQHNGRFSCICDGLQATPGTGTIAIGDIVVTGTVVAAGTALTAGAKVCKATNQPGAAVTTADNTKAEIDIALAKLVAQTKNAEFAWRVISLGNAGAVGDTCVIERVNL